MQGWLAKQESAKKREAKVDSKAWAIRRAYIDAINSGKSPEEAAAIANGKVTPAEPVVTEAPVAEDKPRRGRPRKGDGDSAEE